MDSEYVAVVNRSNQEVVGTFDGRLYVWAPHETKTLPHHVAELCKRQNPVMGTEDFADITSAEYLLALPSDDASPIEQSDAKERYDRDTIPVDQTQQVIELNLKTKGRKNRAAVAPNLPNPVGIQASYDD
jgi:hypothetical protein